MKVHKFLAQKLGWNKEKEIVWFDAEYYTEESARAEFLVCTGYTTKNNGETYPYDYYEYDGQKYFTIFYLGIDEFNG